MFALPQTPALPSFKAQAVQRCSVPAAPVLCSHLNASAQRPELRAGRMRNLVLCQATPSIPSTDPQAEEIENMDDAAKRWSKQVREGKVKSINTKSAGDMIKNDWTMLDVRPREEAEVASVEGAVRVPLYVVDEELSVGTFLKKAMAFGAMGGWWEGGTHMIPNTKFLSEVQKKIPKDKKVVVTCQKGLRSLAASEQLSRAGYASVAWINGGLQTAKKGDLPVVGADDIRMAGIGGLSKVLGWTEVQQQNGKGFLGGSNNLIRLALVILALDGVWFLYDQAQFFLAKGK
ncbi:hypothetical protein WJX73_004939 [Symbiochloris irregularis]|uniref:Rhodanese domain-containing protein n=1 Tax=Symbiochloris irregularis TaxID=706552 RepID=A0AAW1NP37_9CHLO